MAYRRRKAFSKRQADAIRRIAIGNVETKVYMDGIWPSRYLPPPHSAPGSAFPFVPSTATGRYAVNIFSPIPRDVAPTLGTGATTSARHVIGTEFQSVGVAVRLHTRNTGSRNWRMRVSVVSAAWNDTVAYNGFFDVISSNYNWMKQDTVFDDATVQEFNTQNINVLKMRNYSDAEDGLMNRVKRFWCPISGKKKLQLDEQVDRMEVGPLGGRNYYLVVEWDLGWPITVYSPQATDNFQFQLEFSVYFKDP
ncbi:MAG: capsid protein [Genomoviridae sp.]|nr:MAG: capsid protein [Genomoviridae sp.]